MSTRQNGMSTKTSNPGGMSAATEHHPSLTAYIFDRKLAFTMKTAFCLLTLLAGASAFGMSLLILKIGLFVAMQLGSVQRISSFRH
jgi:hypothetical protein